MKNGRLETIEDLLDLANRRKSVITRVENTRMPAAFVANWPYRMLMSRLRSGMWEWQKHYNRTKPWEGICPHCDKYGYTTGRCAVYRHTAGLIRSQCRDFYPRQTQAANDAQEKLRAKGWTVTVDSADIKDDCKQCKIAGLKGDEREIVNALLDRINQGRDVYGQWEVRDNRDYKKEALEEIIDGLHYVAAALIRQKRSEKDV